ncbi:MAG: hydroxylase [Spirochaetaceae bacterium]|nr:MAG: hydroxylase [Spirochaetaceae bacterium]
MFLFLLLSGCSKPGKNGGNPRGAAPEHSIHYLEIVTTDVEAACQHYTKAYGWQFKPAGPELGNSFTAEIPGGSLCGIRGPLNSEETPIVRAYLRVADIQKATQEAERLGATLLLDTMDIPGWGKISIYEFGGIQQGLWQVP